MDTAELIGKCREAVVSYNDWLSACKERDLLFAEAESAYNNFLSVCNEYKDADPNDQSIVELIKNAQRNASVSADAARNSKKKAIAFKNNAIMLNSQAKKLFEESGISMDEFYKLMFAE